MRRMIRTLMNATLSPPRAVYNPSPTISVVTCDGRTYGRERVHFTSDSSFNLIAQPAPPAICLLYLHALATNQFECLNLVPFLCMPELAFAEADSSVNYRRFCDALIPPPDRSIDQSNERMNE
jgi:hypothetical protein